MGKLLLIMAIISASSAAVVRPWTGIVSYYLLAILGPQYIWWWNFDGLRVSLWVAIFTFIGVGLKFLRGELNFSYIRTRMNGWLFMLWICLALSYFLGPYVGLFSANGLKPDRIFSITNNIFLFYFLSTLVACDLKTLRHLGFVFVGITLYLIYWANDQYFTQNWSQFYMGRLMGPRSVDGSSLYADENVFAMLFVAGIPFLYYLGFQLQRRWQRVLLWGMIPLGWHAVFLTGSRGGLLGLGLITLLAVVKSQRKVMVVPLLVVFLLAYQWQAGDTMKQRSGTISKYEGEGSAEMRLAAWKGGWSMICAHPVTGVGLGSFITALPHFYDTSPRVAHNTLIQYAAESGIGAGLSYLMILWCCFRSYFRIGAFCKDNTEIPETSLISALNSASATSFAGLAVCSIFLSLTIYEIFFFLLIFNNTLERYCQRAADQTAYPGLVATEAP
jgi:putative inorganic carbon (hco3(-)) transporter